MGVPRTAPGEQGPTHAPWDAPRPTCPGCMRARARAAQLLIPDGVVCGRTAARIHGLQGLRLEPDDEPVDLVLPTGHTRWQRSGVRLHWFEVDEKSVVDDEGL